MNFCLAKNDLKIILFLLFVLFSSCGSVKKNKDNTQNISFAEIIVHLSKETSSKSLEAEYAEQGFQFVEKLSPSMEMYLFKYNNLSIDSAEIINSLKKHSGIINAQFNHEVNSRN